MSGQLPRAGMKETDVIKADTILFGEKKNLAADPNGDTRGAMDYFMDMYEGSGGLPTGNDVDRIEHGCHGVLRKGGGSGGSNFAFVDGSVRQLRYRGLSMAAKSLGHLRPQSAVECFRCALIRAATLTLLSRKKQSGSS